MKILKANAGSLTNFEVLDFLRSRGASKDPTRVIAPISRSEYKVYDYLEETPASTQTRQSIHTFVEKCKDFKLAKAEILNIINLRPSSIVDLQSIVEKLDDRDIDTDGLLELVTEALPPLPTAESNEKDSVQQTENDEDAITDDIEPMETS